MHSQSPSTDALTTRLGTHTAMSHRHWRSSALLAVALLVALLCGLAALPSGAWAAPGWFAQGSGTTTGGSSVTFANDSDGWAVGLNGTIVATTDGGTTWTPQHRGRRQPLGCCLQRRYHAWAVGYAPVYGGIILATTNGGATWTTQSQGTTYNPCGVACSDAYHAWVVGSNGTIVATTNGGSTWNAQASGTQEYIEAVAFADANTGWAVGEYGTILATTNGGTTWTPQTSGTTSDLRGVALRDANHVWASRRPGTILAATTGGWTAQNSGTPGA